MYTGCDSACATYTNACLVCPVGVGGKRVHAHGHAFGTKICKNEKKKFRYKANGAAAMAEFLLSEGKHSWLKLAADPQRFAQTM